jgi:hypothetical protein
VAFGEKLEELVISPVSLASGVITGVCSAYGMYEAGHFVYDTWGSKVTSIAVFAVLIICALPFFFSRFFWDLRGRFDLPKRERFLLTHARRRWRISRNGDALVETTNSYLFYKEPAKEDLADVAFSSKDLNDAKAQYSSPDAQIIDTEQIRKNVWKFYWQPTSKPVALGAVHEHSYTVSFPFGGSFTSKSFTVAVPCNVLTYLLEIHSEVPVIHHYCYKKRFWQRFAGSAQIVRRAQRVKRRHAPPLTRIDEHTLTWEAGPLRKGETYFVVLLFGEQTEETQGPAPPTLARLLLLPLPANNRVAAGSTAV